jgi:hypothetical protein
MHAIRGSVLAIAKKCRVLCILIAWRLRATQRMRATQAIRCCPARTRYRARAPLKIFFAGTADCASHKLICAKLRKQFSSADRRARTPTKEKIPVVAGEDRRSRCGCREHGGPAMTVAQARTDRSRWTATRCDSDAPVQKRLRPRMRPEQVRLEQRPEGDQ